MDKYPKKIRIGTRGSPLAMTQTRTVRAALAHEFPDLEVEIVVIQTSGDWKPSDGEVRLSEAAGGKGQFAKEIEEALLAGEIDAAVHSMKDMDSFLPDGLIIQHMLPREDVRDVILLRDRERVSDRSAGFDVLEQNEIVGTASVRRAAFLLEKRPDLKVVPFRGNVQTRINKLRGDGSDGEIACTFLALAGLNRLGLQHEADVILSVDEMLPSAGQGAVGIETRIGDAAIMAFFGRISCLNTVVCVKAERAALAVLDGSCHTPIGAYAELKGDEMFLRVQVLSLDGTQRYYEEGHEVVKDIAEAEQFGRMVAQKLKLRVPDNLFS